MLEIILLGSEWVMTETDLRYWVCMADVRNHPAWIRMGHDRIANVIIDRGLSERRLGHNLAKSLGGKLAIIPLTIFCTRSDEYRAVVMLIEFGHLVNIDFISTREVVRPIVINGWVLFLVALWSMGERVQPKWSVITASKEQSWGLQRWLMETHAAMSHFVLFPLL
jgi:hypothetical protein